MTASAASTRLGLVVNPSASAGSAAREAAALAAAFAGHGCEVLDLSARSAGTALAHAQQMVADRAIDLLVVAGGDGMAHLGINVCAGHEIPLGIVALGTGNDIATSLGLPIHDPAASVAMIAAGHSRRVDAGRVDGGGHRPWFGGTLYAGFDAIVNERANRWSWPRGQARYNLAVVRELPVFTAIPYAVTIDGTRTETEAMLVIVAPLYIPLVQKLGFDLVWYGVLYTITCQIAYITPPFGYNLFMMRAMAPPGVTMSDIYKSIWPFVGS